MSDGGTALKAQFDELKSIVEQLKLERNQAQEDAGYASRQVEKLRMELEQAQSIMLTDEQAEVLRRCEAVIYRTEAEIGRRIQQTENQLREPHVADLRDSALAALRAEKRALEMLRQQVMLWRKTGKTGNIEGEHNEMG